MPPTVTRQMDGFKPSKRGTAVGGVNDGPYMPPHMQPGAKATDAFVPGGTAGIQNNQIPKTYDEISNTPSWPHHGRAGRCRRFLVPGVGAV
eukprot:COSAG01_NODE_674_length_14337_cov_14.996418_8_plen_91_part_00